MKRTKFKEYLILNEYESMLTPAWFMCPEGHVFQDLPYNVLEPNYKCPKCEKEYLAVKYCQYIENYA